MDFVKCDAVKYEYKSYEGENEIVTEALRGIGINIKKGDFVGVLGHNGSGKSTFAKIINCLLLPSGGTLSVGDIIVCTDGKPAAEGAEMENTAWRVRQKAGMVFQNPDNQLIASIVEEDVAFGAENLGIRPDIIRQRVDEALEAVGMSNYRFNAPSELSGGQKQRIAIAGILAMEPECIILDEATAMLDPIGRAGVMDTVRRLNKEKGMTVIAITHNMEEVIDADKIYVIDKGKLAMQGTPSEIFSCGDKLDKIREIGLDVPRVAELSERLINAGLNIPKGVLCEEQLIKALSKLEIDKNFSFSLNKAGYCIPETIIAFENISYDYAKGTELERKAVKDISFEIGKGEFIGIIGHTGSGKSTLIQHFNGLITASSGKMLYKGKNMTENKKLLKELRQKVGLVFQYPEYQIFESKIYDEVAFGPKNMGLNDEEIRERVLKALEMVGLDESYCDLSPFNLSGGQKRRIAIASVLAMEPEVLVLDEPMAGLDPMGRRELLSNIRELNRQGMTIIMVSHDMDIIAEAADRILVMNNGEKIAFDTPDEIFRDREALRKIGLDVPAVSSVMTEIRNVGADIPSNVYDMDTAVEILSRCFK